MGALSLTRRVGGPVENWIIFGSVRNRGKSCRLSDANSMTHLRARTPAEIRHLATRAAFPQRRSSNANTLCGQNSAGFLQICKTFKGIICDDISEFESYMPSHAVRSPSAKMRVVPTLPIHWRVVECLGGLEAMAIIPVALPLQRSRAVRSPSGQCRS